MTDRPDTSMNPTVIDEFRANGGKVGGLFTGATLLLLHTTGAKSGQQRVSPVMYFRFDGKLMIVGSYAGADVDPAWVHNLRAHSRAHIEIGTESYDVESHELPRAERDVAFGHVVKTAPGFGEYQSKTDRIIPVFELGKV
jgi:deazaflavin-dependent oxidoreductase (nitroreductase family)